jgi:hypothetical protein
MSILDAAVRVRPGQVCCIFVSASDYIYCERLLGGPGSPIMERIDINLLAEFRLAAKRLKGTARRSWFAWACNNYASGSPRAAETIFGWNRKAVARGLSELDPGTVRSEPKKRLPTF